MKTIWIFLFFSITIHNYANLNYVNKQFNTAKAIAYFNSDYKLSHYGFISYDKKQRKLKEEHISPDGNYLSYTLYKYDKKGLLVKEETFNSKKQLIQKKTHQYSVKRILTQSKIQDSEQQFTVKYTYGYRNGRPLYREETWLTGYDLHHIVRITYNLQKKPGKIEYFEPNENDFSDEAKLLWSESIYYKNSGKIDYIIRVDHNKIARNLIRFLYSDDWKLKKILVYEGYVQFKHKMFNYKDQFKLVQKAKLIYKLTGKLAALRDRIYKKDTRGGAVEIEVVFYDLPDESAELPRPIESLPLSLKKQEVIKKVDKKTGKVIVVKEPILESWALNINKARTSNLLFSTTDNILVPVEDGKLLSISKNGKLRWSLKTDGNIIIGPQEYAGIYYLGTDKGTIYAVNQGKGSVIWSKKNLGAFKKGSPLHITEKAIIFVTNKKWLRALNRNDGNTILWSYEGENKWSSGPVGNGKYTFVSEGNNLFCINVKDGDEEWDREFNDPIKISPIPFAKNIIVFTEYDIVAIDITEEDKRWELKGIGIITKPFLKGNSLYLGTDEGRLIRINAINGTLDWEKTVNMIEYSLSGNDNNLFLSLQDDYFIVIDYRTGDEKSRYEGKRSDTINSPIVVESNGNAIYYTSKSKALYKDTIR